MVCYQNTAVVLEASLGSSVKSHQFCLDWDIVSMQIRIRLFSHGL